MGAEDVRFPLCFWRRSLLVLGSEKGHICMGTGENAGGMGWKRTRSFIRDVDPSLLLPVTRPFNYPFSPSLTIRIAALPGLICWRRAMALLNSATYQMSGTRAVTSPAVLRPASNPRCPPVLVQTLLGKTFHLGWCVTQGWHQAGWCRNVLEGWDAIQRDL